MAFRECLIPSHHPLSIFICRIQTSELGNPSLELIAQTESFIQSFHDPRQPSYVYLGDEQCLIPPYTVEALSQHFGSFLPSTVSGATSVTSDNYLGSIFEDLPPSRPWPTNHVSISHKDESICGTFVIKPSLRVSETFAGITDNFHGVVDSGGIDVDIWLVDDELPSGMRERSSGETKAVISLTMVNSRDDLVVRLVNMFESLSVRNFTLPFSIDQCLFPGLRLY
jgi:hypothetical protein